MNAFKIIAHSDLDGVISAVVATIGAQIDLSPDSISVSFLDYSSDDEFTTDLANALGNETYQHVFILDLALRSNQKHFISTWMSDNPDTHVTWIDHHPTSSINGLPESDKLFTYLNATAECAAEIVSGVVLTNLARADRQPVNTLISLAAIRDQHRTTHFNYKLACKLSDAILVATANTVYEEISKDYKAFAKGCYSKKLNDAIQKATEFKYDACYMALCSAATLTLVTNDSTSIPAVLGVCNGFGYDALEALKSDYPERLCMVLDTAYGAKRDVCLRMRAGNSLDESIASKIHIGKLCESFGGGGHEHSGGIVISNSNEFSDKLLLYLASPLISCFKSLSAHTKSPIPS